MSEEETKSPQESAVETFREAEAGSFAVNVSGRSDDSDKKSSSVPFAAKLPLIICGIGLALLPLIFSAMTVLYPFHLAANGIGKIVQFPTTLKDKVVHLFTGEYLEAGDVPEELNNQLQEVNIDIGVETADGDFIKTNKIIAYSGSEYIVAAADGSEYRVKAPATGSTGKLEVRFTPSDGRDPITYRSPEAFRKALETDDELYMALDKGLGGDSLFFYDRSGENTFSDLGINRDPYHDFDVKIKEIEESPTEDEKKELSAGKTAEQVAFEELFADAVDYDPKKSATSTGGVDDTTGEEGGVEETSEEEENEDRIFDDVFEGGDSGGSGVISEKTYPQTEKTLADARKLAEEYISNVARTTKASDEESATKKAAALLNAAISANEPYQASRASSAILVAAEQAKAGYGGPVNEMATFMTADYADVPDNEESTSLEEKSSASDSENLGAIVTNVDFSKEAAKEYSRDRGSVKKAVTEEGKDVTVSVTSGFKRLISWIVGLFTGTKQANEAALQTAFKDDIAKAIYMKSSTLMKGERLGEKITEGLSFLNANLTKNAGGTNASGEEAVALYNSYTKKLYDRRVLAERSTKSPFDLTSPNTFFGSLANNLYTIGISDSSAFGKFAKLGSLATKSFGSLMLGAYADDLSTNTYLGVSGDCPTVGAIKAEGDIYCTQKTTYDLSILGESSEGGEINIITATMADYAEGGVLYDKIKDSLVGGLVYESNDKITGGGIKEDSDAADYIVLNADRGSTPGVKDANVCERKKRKAGVGGFFSYLFGGGAAVAESCSGDAEKYGTGEIFANVEGNDKWKDTYRYIQGYYLEVYARELTGYYKKDGQKNPLTAYRDEYYEKNPKDESFEGIIAYRTGWSKEDVIAGIEAYNYLAYLNNYDPTSRLAFFEISEEVEIYFEETPIPTDTRLADKNKIIFDEKRNRVVLI